MENLGGIGLSEEQADLLAVAENFAREKSSIETVRDLLDDERGFDDAIWEEIAALGWLGVAIPENFGGAGLTLAEAAPIAEQLGRNLYGGPFSSTTIAAQAILAGGAGAQKVEALPKIAEGAPATVALMEASGCWDLTRPELEATATSGGFSLTGKKRFVQDAAAAHWIVLSANNDGKLELFLLDKDDIPNGALRRETIVDETKRSYELFLDNVQVPAARRMDPDRAVATLKTIELTAALLSTAEMVGGTSAVIDYTIDYLKTRKQFGKLIGAYQALQHPTVDAYVEYEQARSHLYSAAYSFNEQGTGEVATRMAKAKAEKAYAYAADRSIQFHGGFGFTYDCDAQLHRRRALFNASQYGDAAYQRKKLAELLF